MGNTHVKPHPRTRNKKQVHWKAAARPQSPGKPQLVSEIEALPDLIAIRWTKPNSDGGSPISGYLVEHRRQGSPHWVRATPLLIQSCELTISGLEPGWRYQFRVSAQNAVGISDYSESSELITVTVHRSAVTAPRFTQELQELTALENEKAEFEVHFLGQPAPKVCWFKDTFEIFSSRRIRILTESDRSVLTIHQCSLSDEGEIKCTATNRAGHVSTKAKLTVEAAPSIRLPRQYADGLLFEIGEMIRLKVSVAGRPTPLVFWSHNGESIKNNERYETEYVDKCSILKINEAERDDRGEYQIKAVNKLGQDIQSFLVTVTDKPSPPGKARVVMALGRSVTLSWSIPQDDGGCKIGNYIVEYYRLGWNVWLKAATSRTLTTILGDLIEGSEYKFRVKAESPYGVSDPSDETDVIFIPDPKRGILQPPSRGRSQPREITQASSTTPVVSRRKNKPRSQSSSRVDSSRELGVEPPVRPERTKVKSPPITPQRSPAAIRKDIDTKINKEIFERSDRSSMARDLAYGTPDINVKKNISNQINNLNSSSDISRTPSPAKLESDKKQLKVKIEPPSEIDSAGVKKSPSSETKASKSLSPSPEARRASPRVNNENFTGSSEFMLVLYPGENEKDQSDYFFDENAVPPPMSLSAPELGAEQPLFENLRNSSSSTEILHERAMIRLYQAAEAEEKELEKRRRSISIPKIRINSKDEENIVSVERNQLLKRRLSAGGVSHQQALWAQRRHSLKTPLELKEDLLEQRKLSKYASNINEKRALMMTRERSESEEKEEQAFEEFRKRMNLQKQSSTEKRQLNVVDEDNWADDYVSSTEEESETESSSAEKLDISNETYKSHSCDSEEELTYHPRSMISKPISDEEPFEILTRRKEPPSPDFIPKPILKKPERGDLVVKNTITPDSSPNTTLERSSSPMPKNIFKRARSHSLADTAQSIKSLITEKPKLSRPRSSSVATPQDMPTLSESSVPKPTILEPRPNLLMSTISTVAQISGITAASIVIPEKLLERQKDAEEAKVVIDHYGDIVRNYGSRRKSNTPIYTDRDSLKTVADNVETSRTQNFADKDNVSSKNIDTTTTNFIKSRTFSDDLPKSNKNIQPEEVYARSPIIESTISEKSLVGNDKSVPNVASENQLKNIMTDMDSQKAASPKSSPSREKSQELNSGSSNHSRKSPSPKGIGIWSSQQHESETRISSLPNRREIKRKSSPLRTKERKKSSDYPIYAQEKIKSVSPIKKYVSSENNLVRPQRSGYRPMLKEIMTQTSEGLESFDSDSYSRTSSPSDKHEELFARAKLQVRSLIDYVTDLAMFFVACWLYLFKNELLAIPVLLVMAYRQLQEEIANKIPNWLKRRFKRKDA